MTQCSSPAAAGGVDWLPRREKRLVARGKAAAIFPFLGLAADVTS